MKKKLILDKKMGLGLLIATLLVIAACDDKPETEKPDPVVPTPIEKTYVIELKDGALKFNVKYMALPDVDPPAYLTYLKERLDATANSGIASNQESVKNLINNGGYFTIIVQTLEETYDGLIWNGATRVFKVHNNWISNASGPDLSPAMIRDAFNSVTPVENAMLKTSHNLRKHIMTGTRFV